MQKIKYIIIFTLILALGILYLQIDDYTKITDRLITENRSSNQNRDILDDKINSLEKTNLELTNQIITLQDRIISLEEELTLSKINMQNNIEDDTNYTAPEIDINQEILLSNDTNNSSVPLNAPIIDTNDTLDIKPSITLDDENKITGFNIEYKEEF